MNERPERHGAHMAVYLVSFSVGSQYIAKLKIYEKLSKAGEGCALTER